jgi:hypothetical protein
MKNLGKVGVVIGIVLVLLFVATTGGSNPTLAQIQGDPKGSGGTR